MHVEKHSVAITTNGSGAGTGYTPPVTGRVLGIRYVKTDFADGIDFTVTVEDTGEAILTVSDVNASASFYPRPAVHDAAGAVLEYVADFPLGEPIAVAFDRIKIVVASGGDTKTGTFHVVIG